MSDMFGMPIVDTNTILNVGYEFTKKQLKELEDLREENKILRDAMLDVNGILFGEQIGFDHDKWLYAIQLSRSMNP